MPDPESLFYALARADAAADKKHQDILARVRASLNASRAAVRRLQQSDLATLKNVPPAAP
jgi:hypothetical protein